MAKYIEIKGFKGFNADMTCRGFQFKQGETYKCDDAVICESGFHFCEHPLDVFSYYPPAESVFCEVVGTGKTVTHDQDTKVSCTEIKIGARLNLSSIIKAAVDFTFNRSTKSNSSHTKTTRGAASATGYRGAASATGYSGAASATGYRGAASATGDSGAASATGYRGAASATGDSGAASATGDRGAASATGYSGAASATGYSGAASATGDSGAASATGYRGAASATGYRGAASATGYSGAASATGYSGAASATGYRGAASATGKHSISCGLGVECEASGAIGCWIVLAERKWNGKEYEIKTVKAAKVDGKKIKENIFYMLKSGKFVECK